MICRSVESMVAMGAVASGEEAAVVVVSVRREVVVAESEEPVGG